MMPWIALGSLWKHLKTGNIYVVVGRCRLEHSGNEAILYVEAGGNDREQPWARDLEEFQDGRFEEIDIKDLLK